MGMGRRGLLLGLTGAALCGCAKTPIESATPTPSVVDTAKPTASAVPSVTPSAVADALPTREAIVAQFGSRVPKQWGMEVTGLVRRHSGTSVVLTFDACGGPFGSKVDSELVDFLIAQKIPAVLFLNQRWIEVQRPLFDRLASMPELFDLGNHGTRHMPLSVSGKSAYKEQGTANVGEVYDEVAGNHRYMAGLLGKPPRFFRTGTAHYDEVAVEIVRALGEIPIGFDVNGDAGTTFTQAQVVQETAKAKPGSIVIGHFNQPKGATFEGMAAVLPQMRAKGIVFSKLSDVM